MDRQKVKSGLGLMFWGNIVALFAVIPILGVIAALVGGIMELIAIVTSITDKETFFFYPINYKFIVEIRKNKSKTK